MGLVVFLLVLEFIYLSKSVSRNWSLVLATNCHFSASTGVYSDFHCL